MTEGLRVEGWASVFDWEDNSGDIVVAGAFKRTLLERPHVAMMYSHEPGRVIGRWDLVEERDYGLWVEGLVFDEHLKPLIAERCIMGLSIGYQGRGHSSDDKIRTLSDVELMEVSLTPTPMNSQCVIQGIG